MKKSMKIIVSRREQYLIEKGDLFLVRPDICKPEHADLTFICKLPKSLLKQLKEYAIYGHAFRERGK